MVILGLCWGCMRMYGSFQGQGCPETKENARNDIIQGPNLITTHMIWKSI